MSFYNRYSPKPDYGGGIQDLVSQFMQFYMMKKMLGGDKSQELANASPMGGVMGAGGMAPGAPGLMGMGGQPQGAIPTPPMGGGFGTPSLGQPSPGGMGASPMGQGGLPPELLQMIMQYLMKARPGGGL